MDVGKLVGHLISVGYVLAALGILSAATSAIRREVKPVRFKHKNVKAPQR